MLPQKFSPDNPIWTAPETTISLKSDIYSLSMVLWEIVNWKAPFLEVRFFFEIANRVQNGYRPEFEVPVNPTFKQLIEDGWQSDPAMRPSSSAFVRRLKEVAL